MTIKDIIWWADPLLEYGIQEPTCLMEDYACWDFSDEENFSLVSLTLDDGIFYVGRGIGTISEPLLLYTRDSHEPLHAALDLLDALNEQRYGGMF